MKNMKIQFKWLGLATLIFLLSLNAFPQAANRQTSGSSITGYVFNPQRRPVPEIPVELMNEVNSVIQRTRTDGSGRYYFRGLSGGRFAVRVLPFGTDLEEQVQEVEIVTFGGLGRPVSDNVQKDFYLRMRREKNPYELTGTIYAQEVPEEARKTYEKAVDNLGDEKVEAGVEGLEKALQLFPDYYMALEKLGFVYTNQQKFEKARDVFNRAVAINERGFNSWYGLSFANYALKQSGAAIEAAQKALVLDQNSVSVLILLGISQRQDKRYEEAEKSLVQAKKLDKGRTPEIHWNLALLYAHNLKRFNDAADELELYLKADPDNPNKNNIKKLIKKFRENPAESN